MEWLAPWEPVTHDVGSRLDVELRAEVGAGHPLEGWTVRAIARHEDDAVLFELQPERRFAVVRLTGRGRLETAPTPPCEIYWSIEDFAERRMKPDRDARGNA